MLRGGLAGLGGRGGLGALDPVAAPPIYWTGLLSQDQGGAFAAASTRVHFAGLHAGSGAQALVGQTTNLFQSVGAGQMAYAIPQFFPRAGRITRLVTRTNGTTGNAGTPRLKMGVYTSGVLGGSSVFAGSPYPADRQAQSSDLNLGGGGVGPANLLLESLINVNVDAGTYRWFVVVWNAQAVTNQHAILGLARYALAPIHGYSLDATTPTTIDQDALTFGVGFRHAITYVTSDDLPNPFPQTSPASLTGGATVSVVNVPAIGFGWVPA